MKWIEKHIEINIPKKTKKLTATRFAAVLGYDTWSTDFEKWCEITKTYEKPFEDTKYTIAGKAIEPLQISYMRKAYFMTNIKTPTDIYGKDYFNKTYGDFFKKEPIFGGMWDSLLYGADGKPDTVIEFKTTKRAEDWESDVPEYYALQAALYAYLLGVDDVIMVCSFLEEKDYLTPEKYIPSSKNTIVRPFKISVRYPNFESKIREGVEWWHTYVETGISPDFDEKKDAEILKALRKNNVNPDTDVNELIKAAEDLETQIELIMVNGEIAEKEKRLKQLKDQIKTVGISNFRDGDKKVAFDGAAYEWTVSKSESTEIDKAALETDGLLEKYSKPKITYTLKNNKKEGN